MQNKKNNSTLFTRARNATKQKIDKVIYQIFSVIYIYQRANLSINLIMYPF